MTAVDRTPPYLQVVQHLRGQIVSGELRDGDRISVRQTAEKFQISQATAMRVISTLRADGLAESTVGIGTVVRTRKTLHRSARDRFTRMLATGRIYAPGEYAEIKDTGLAPAYGPVADALGIEDGARAIFRHRVTFNENGPVSASTSWFSADLAGMVPALLVRDQILGGTPSAIREATGRTATHAEDRMTVGWATQEQAAELEIPDDSPVLLGFNVLRDSDGEVIEIGECVSGPGRWTQYVYNLS